jgi:integrase
MVPHVCESTLGVAMGKVKHGLPHFTVHDFRRTARTHLAALGVEPHVAERCLNHKLKGVEGVYNRHDYFEERRRALEALGQLLLKLERQQPPTKQSAAARQQAPTAEDT